MIESYLDSLRAEMLACRIKNNLNMIALSVYVGVNHVTLSGFMQKKRFPSIEFIQKMEKYLRENKEFATNRTGCTCKHEQRERDNSAD